MKQAIPQGGSADDTRQRLRPLQQQPTRFVEHAMGGAAHMVSFFVCIAAWSAGCWPLCLLLWPVIAWMDHAALSRLHEAAHGMLVKSRPLNEWVGITIGTASLTPLTVYRYVHARHHAHLGREQDPEFRPYNQPQSPRWLRISYAWLELACGWIFTPALYSIRTARAWPSLPNPLRLRLLGEWCVLVGFWSVFLIAVDLTQTWPWFVVAHLIPAWIAGSLQTVRKFTEHLGKMGETIAEMTRTVVYTGPIGRAASRSQLYVDHHGTHHRWPRIPFHNLPQATSIVYAAGSRSKTYPTHFAAIREMLPHLLDPKVGPQWKHAESRH